MLRVGDAVRYFDPHGMQHDALLTAIWTSTGEILTEENAKCAVNLVWISEDDTKKDPYGRQIERQTSVVGKSQYTTFGNYWEPLEGIV